MAGNKASPRATIARALCRTAMGALVLASSSLPARGTTPADQPFELGKGDAARLAAYRADGVPVLALAVVARTRRNAELAAAVTRLGGRVDYRLDAIDYLSIALPAERVEAFLREPALQAVAVDMLGDDYGNQAYWLPSSGGGGEAPDSSGDEDKAPAPSPVDGAPARPLERWHSILRDMDGTAFSARDPRFDGRGVVIAHVEQFPDFLLPELQTARDAKGAPVAKFADILRAPATAPSLDPDATPPGDGWSTPLSSPITSEGGAVLSGGRRLTVPQAGTYRLARVEFPRKSPMTKRLLAVLKRPADGKQDPLVVDLLWSDAGDTLWIDTDGDGDFADERGVQPYSVSGQIGVLGTDDPATAARETLGFAVQREGNRILLNFGSASHSTMVDGAAAASRGETGKIDGVAPGAQLLPIAAMDGNATTAYVRGIAAAYLDPRVDVVLIEGNYALLGPYSRKDGSSLIAMAISRLVDRYRKPTFITALNQPGMTQSGDLSVPSNVIGVGASDYADTIFANFGWQLGHARALHSVGAEGPSGDGALKPDLLAPAGPLSVAPRFGSAHGGLYPGMFRLPSGYQICGGTSCATPVAAGAAALLVGAAKLNGVAHDATAVNTALRDSADFDPDIPAYKQGRGFLRIDHAWQQMHGPPAYAIDVAAPVRTAILHSETGRGLFEREGWHPGDHGSRTVWLTRRSGPKGPLQFDIRWEGDKDAFGSASRIGLPLNRAVPLRIDIVIDGPRAYSANALLSRPGQADRAAAIPATIVVPHDFTAQNGFAWADRVAVPRPGRLSRFFRIPEGTGAFSVKMKTGRKRMRMLLLEPGGTMENFDQFAMASEVDGTATLSVEAPRPGVWEVLLSDQQDYREFDWSAASAEPFPDTPVELTATVATAKVTEDAGKLRIESRQGAFTGGVETSALGGMRSRRATLAPGQTLGFDIDVEPGQPILAAQVTPTGADSGDVDLHLYDCTRGTCWIARRGNRPGSRERVVIDHPAAGKWKAVLVAAGGGRPVEVDYSDLYTDPRLGTLATTDAARPRKPGEQWAAERTFLPSGVAPRPGYQLTGVTWLDAQGFSTTMFRTYDTFSQWPLPGHDAILSLETFSPKELDGSR